MAVFSWIFLYSNRSTDTWHFTDYVFEFMNHACMGLSMPYIKYQTSELNIPTDPLAQAKAWTHKHYFDLRTFTLKIATLYIFFHCHTHTKHECSRSLCICFHALDMNRIE